MRFSRSLIVLLCLAVTAAGWAARPVAAGDDWSRLDAVAQEAVAAGNVPGVVLLVGHKGRVVYRKAFGNRVVQPETVPMTTDTVFDLASLTKVVATTSAVMALIEDGKLRLRDTVVQYWPEFGQNGKGKITIRHLLTHTSGLASWRNFEKELSDPMGPQIQDHREQVLAGIAGMSLANPMDTKFVYSDLGFITLGEIVRRVSGVPLDQFVRRRVFEPLKMRHTGFNPDEKLSKKAAPTTMRAGKFLQGAVHDGNSAMCGGVAGHAGLFSTADDLAKFAEMLLSSDRTAGTRFPLSPYTVREMTTPHSPPGLPVRGLGWDIDTSYSHVRGDLLPRGSFGHTGFTGTFIWVDPYSDTFIIGLSNRVHPDGKGNPLGLWAKASNIVAGIVRPQVMPARLPVSAAQPARQPVAATVPAP